MPSIEPHVIRLRLSRMTTLNPVWFGPVQVRLFRREDTIRWECLAGDKRCRFKCTRRKSRDGNTLTETGFVDYDLVLGKVVEFIILHTSDADEAVSA